MPPTGHSIRLASSPLTLTSSSYSRRMPPAPLAVRDVALVVNTSSRRGVDAFATAQRLLTDAGIAEVRGYEVHAGSELPAALEAALATAPQLLVVGGGDGTVGAAAGLVAGERTRLGVLPVGTANDFARTLGIPSDLESAVRTLLTGKVVDVDLGRANGRPFLNVASVGLAGAVTERLTPRLKRRLGRLAYAVATVAAYRAHVPFAARLEFPDGDHPAVVLDDLLQIAVGNGRHYGGGNTVSPTASIDDHLLDLYAIVRGRWHEHLSIARLLRDGRLVEHERVHHLTARRVRVVTTPPLLVNLDGELATLTPATFEVERNAVHVVVPASSTAARWDGRAGAA